MEKNIARSAPDRQATASDHGSVTRTTFGKALLAWLAGIIHRHHNRIQFFGYEAANILLVVHRAGDLQAPSGGLAYEALAASAFMVGSACIYAHHPDRRPVGLFCGSLGLILGGILLILAGYPLTGSAVTLASMETARGALAALQADLERPDRSDFRAARSILVLGRYVLAFYIIPVDRLCRRIGRLGRILNDRPFLTSAAIKLPLRLEFIVRNLLRGDMIGTAVGLSWMILGDGALAVNDPKLRRSLLGLSKAPTTRKQKRSTGQMAVE